MSPLFMALTSLVWIIGSSDDAMIKSLKSASMLVFSSSVSF